MQGFDLLILHVISLTINDLSRKARILLVTNGNVGHNKHTQAHTKANIEAACCLKQARYF